MKAVRFGLLGLLLAGLCFSDGAAQDRKKLKNKNAPASPPLTAESLSAPLVPPEILAKLNLTAAQKPDADKLTNDFAAKNKALVAKLPASATSSTPAKGKNKGAPAALPAELQAVLVLRVEYEKKFEELLTEAQKKTYDELLARRAEALLSGKK